jgi:hypothetical protein
MMRWFKKLPPVQPGTPSPAYWEQHYKILFERASSEVDSNQAMLFNAWRTMAGQTRGLQRQSRLIKRLQRENGRLQQEKEALAAEL